MGYVNGVPDFSDNPLCPQSFWWCCPNEHNLLGPLDTACCPASPVEFLEANHVKPFILETSWNHSLIALPRTPQTWLCPILAEIVPIVLATLVATILVKLCRCRLKFSTKRYQRIVFPTKWNLAFMLVGIFSPLRGDIQKSNRTIVNRNKNPIRLGAPFIGLCFNSSWRKWHFRSG